MKIAITSAGNTLDSTLDERFGRCAYFVIHDTESKSTRFVLNTNKEAQEGAGPASVQLIASEEVNEIVSGEFGMKIKSLLDSLNIKMTMIKEHDKKISEIIEMYNH